MSQPEQEYEQALRALLAEVCKADVSDAGLDDDLVLRLGLDSLAGLRLLAAVEKRLDVRFPNERLKEFRTLGRILEFVADSRQENQP